MKIEHGYIPGIVGDIVSLHARYYNQQAGFGAFFESKLAVELGEFVSRLPNRQNQIWHISHSGRIAGSIAINGGNGVDDGNDCAQLRWFIVSDDLRGRGAGGQLLKKAIDFCRDRHFSAVELWTFDGLDAARHLYLKSGFRLNSEHKGKHWGTEVVEQKYRLHL